MEQIQGLSKLLQNNPLFEGISPSEARKMLSCLNPKQVQFEKGETIFQRGSSISTLGLIAEGRVLILKEDYWGHQEILAHLGQGDLFGESYACLPQVRLEVWVKAETPAQILLLDVSKVLSVCSSACQFHNRLLKNLLWVMAKKNQMLSRKMDCISPRTTREKLLAYFSQQAQAHGNRFQIPFTRQQLADYLSVDRSAMTVELYRMKRDGLVDFQGRDFWLL